MTKGARKTNQIVIRLRRKGHIKSPLYDVVVTYRDKRSSGYAIDKLGFLHIDPVERIFYMNMKKFVFWVRRGAFINWSVKKYLIKYLV